ncbi:TRADD-N-associated membrane domain-containing protein [Amycolatopsis sp. lyj-109]|uniref:TRADD-N-associated membrane domain-containing protein n=1 Tax=Amycolatopsis sp. lyj-109 TaxID=2789287 RepID=UPI00397E012E
MSGAIENVAKADPGNIQEVAASQLALSNSYYQSVLSQARSSFLAAITSAAAGLMFFIASLVFAMINRSSDAAYLSALAGGIVEVISGLNFWLFGRTSAQLDAFHVRLEKTQRYLLANSVSTSLPEEARTEVVASLVQSMVQQAATQTPSPSER